MSRLREVAPGVLVATSSLFVTTSVAVVAPDESVLLVDPAWTPDELAALGADLVTRDLVVHAGLATHFHYDHLLWHPSYGLGVPRWASAATVEIAAEHRADLLAALGADWPPELAALFALVEAVPAAGPEGADIGWAGLDVELIEHDAHARGHLAVWIPDRGVLLAGDILSDIEIPLPDEAGGLAAYAAALDALAPYVARATVLVPGHGAPTNDPGARLDADRRYLDAVLAGREPDDARLANEGMSAAHVTNTKMV